VTGAGRGIGHATALMLAGEGWRVVGLELDRDLAAEAKANLGADHDVVVGDITSRDDLRAAAARACELAPLGGWVNNAAVYPLGNLHDPVELEAQRVLDVNVSGTFWASSVAVQTFVSQRSPGSIVNFSSIHARNGFSGWAAYATSKGAIEALTRYTAAEYAAVGIRANAVAPGVVRGPSVERFLEEADDPAVALAMISQGPPMGRIGEASEVAATVSFLLSERASYITGQCIGVDGGWSTICSPAAPDPALASLYDLG
jgi:NAD(P)-dependent dehydrogenase (short-subunit alcohol dehydrogenase family)